MLMYIPEQRNPSTEKQPQLKLWTLKYTYSPSPYAPRSVYNCIVDFSPRKKYKENGKLAQDRSSGLKLLEMVLARS